MQNLIFSLIAALVVGGAVVYFLSQQIKQLKKEPEEQSMKMLLQLVGDLRRDVEKGQGQSREELERKLHQMTMMLKQHQTDTGDALQKQFKQSAGIIQEVTKNLTTLQETNKQIVGFAEQMKSLENILKNPKQRGILGEYVLETALSSILPPAAYQMQYTMKTGEIVDAAIFYNKMVIPVDSKFSLEKYNKMMEETDAKRRSEIEKGFKADIKKRIDETAKYIKPSEGTTEFAFMFIPAEGVYYNLLIYNVGGLDVNSRNLMEYAFEKRVIIVSPTSFFAYLQTVIQGMKALEMSENVTQTLKNIEVLGRHVNAYDEYMAKLGKHLGTTVNTYNSASREFKKIDKDVHKLTSGAVGGDIELRQLEKPVEELS